MQEITAVDFIKSPALYLDRVNVESIVITKEGRPVAVLAKPDDTPISSSLLGLLRDTDIESLDT